MKYVCALVSRRFNTVFNLMGNLEISLGLGHVIPQVAVRGFETLVSPVLSKTTLGI